MTQRLDPGLQRELLHAISNNVPLMLSIIDDMGRILWINPEWERVLGWSLEEAQRLDIFAEEYPDPDERAETLEWIRTGLGWRDYPTRRKDGIVIDTSWTSVRLLDGSIFAIGQDITERNRTEREVLASREQLRHLSARADAKVERERSELARELHDQVGQILTGLKMDVAGLHQLLVLGATPSLAFDDKTTGMMSAIDAMVLMTRQISLRLRPVALDRLGLLDAIEWQAQDFERHSGIRCRCQRHVESPQIDAAAATQAFRIVQEALTNAWRHAHASRVNIVSTERRGALRVEVRDNGRGISDIALSDPEALGLVGMRERALLVNGQLTVGRGHQKGTVVTISVPLHRPTAAKQEKR